MILPKKFHFISLFFYSFAALTFPVGITECYLNMVCDSGVSVPSSLFPGMYQKCHFTTFDQRLTVTVPKQGCCEGKLLARRFPQATLELMAGPGAGQVVSGYDTHEHRAARHCHDKKK